MNALHTPQGQRKAQQGGVWLQGEGWGRMGKQKAAASPGSWGLARGGKGGKARTLTVPCHPSW